MSWNRIGRLGAFSLLLAGLVAAPSLATFGGENGRISYSRFVEKSKSVEIFTAMPDGSDTQRISTSGKNHASLISEWSPDGQTIAFDSDRVDIDGRKNVVQIYTMNADGTGVAQLTRGPGFHGTVSYTPDGTKLAIESDWGDRSLGGLYVIPASDPDGVTVDEATRVTDPPDGVDFDTEPQYSPDGNTLVFSRFKSPEKSAIMKVNVDGTGLTRLTSFRVNASDPDWSPDGQTIAFDSHDGGRPGGAGNIYVMNPDGGDRQRLTKNKPLVKGGPFKLAQNPVFSPNGTRIAYTQFFGGGDSRLTVMNTNGSNKQLMLRSAGTPNKVDWGTHP